MVMANTLSRPTEKSLSPKEARWQELVAQALVDGKTPGDIAKRLANGDMKRYHQVYGKVRRLAQRDARFQANVMAMAKGEAIFDLGPSVKAIGARAKRGRPDAAKLLWSMTGFHSERISHEHSGDIQINVSIPRPAKPSEATGIGPGKEDESYVDVDVVED